jgi:hypothetical protein
MPSVVQWTSGAHRDRAHAVYAAAERSEQRLGLPVNPTVRSAKAWRDGLEALVVTAKSGPRLVVVAKGDEVA